MKWKNVWGMEVRVGDRLLIRYPRVVEVTNVTPGKNSAGAAYLYKVRALSGQGGSPDSNIDLATTVIFTDLDLAVETFIRTAHFTELLTAVNAVRALAGLTAVAFTAPAPADNNFILGAHIGNLRSGLDPARVVTHLDP